MNIKNLEALKIHRLTKSQYDRENEAGRIDNEALYLVPTDTLYATKKELEEQYVNKETLKDYGTKEELKQKAPNDHMQSADSITNGTFSGEIKANNEAMQQLNIPQVRNIYAGTADMIAGETELASGSIYFVYE